ncbi:UNVERIFIED_CONTAM: replication factor C, subunit 5, putative [Hammondia hammondi]|eukprot:XP_008883982.1 replication factor C, subunit 5, putative [Hammondia hammondi]
MEAEGASSSEPRNPGKAPEKASSQLPSAHADRALPWVEKYRPERLSDVLAHDDIIRTIRHYVNKGQLPHLLFHGPPGTGKTSTILAVAKEFYGSAVRTHVLELNASDDRGINTVREQIKTFAETSSTSFQQNRLIFGKSAVPASEAAEATSSHGQEKKGQAGPSLKLIILDEADQMTNAAQNALRRIMEAYARNVRFCLICNFVNKITPAIQSRCTGFRFTPVSSASLKQKAAQIAQDEKMKLSNDGLDALVKVARGDMRRLLNCMQASHLAHPGEEVNADIVHRTLGLPPPSEVTTMFERLLVADFFACCKELDELVTAKGYAMRDWVIAFHERILRVDWPANVLITFISRLADLEERLATGASEAVQMHAVVAAFFEARAGLQAAAAATPPIPSQ